METTRRSFIGGIIASIAGGEALVKLATEQETSTLVVNQPVGLIPQMQCIAFVSATRCRAIAVPGSDLCIHHGGRSLASLLGVGDVLFVQRGEVGFVPVGIATVFKRVQFATSEIEVHGEFLVYGGPKMRSDR